MTNEPVGMKRLNDLICETDAAYHEASVRLGIADSVMQILYTICRGEEQGSCSIQEIRRRTGISKQTLNSALRKLENEDVLYLAQGDGRKKKICLTAEGERKARETAGRLIQAEDEILSSWTEEEIEIYLKLTERYLREFRVKIEEFPEVRRV